MIVLPRLLGSVLADVEGDLVRLLPVEYAVHAVAQRKGGTPELLEVLDVVRGYVLGEVPLEGLLLARDRLYELGTAADGMSGEVDGLVHLALNASCQRDLELAGVQVRNRHQPKLADVAAAAQDDAANSNLPRNASVSRWEEARWQLLHVIESVPSPGSPPSDR